jgi:carboxyl-terminal processing protease
MNRAFSSFLILFLILFQESPAQPTRSAAGTAFMITRMAEIYHVQPRVVDKTFSADLYDQVIRALDADKIYFSADDIRQLNSFKYVLDDQLLNKKEDFLKQLIIIYTIKINQTDSILDALSKSNFDLSLNETYRYLKTAALHPMIHSGKSKFINS